MDARALENLKVKIEGLVNNCVLMNSSIEDDENWKRIENLALSVSKLKAQWISQRQAQMMISSIVARAIPKPDDGSRLSGKLSDFIDSAELCVRIYNRIIGLPYHYDIYYELPSISLPNGAGINVGSGISLQMLSDNFVRRESLASKLGVNVQGESCYLRTKVAGYCDYDSAAVTPQESLTLVKVFIERGKAFGVLVDDIFSKMWPRKTAKPVVYIHEIDDGSIINSISLPISKDIAEALTSIQLSTALYREGGIEKIFVEGMKDFLKLTSSNDLSLARIIAACEWSFDADSEHVPAMKVVKTCIGLESVYGEDNSEGGLTKSLSDRCGYSLASSAAERKDIMRKCRDLYQLRSSVVHGVQRKLSFADTELLDFGMSMLTSSINKEISLLPDLQG
ncbi:hypothetical protein HK44_020795 [Pseudomonas fluorescens HK44]|uniref:Uncharacterized protein n=1 Tax=Pseudomonas fluorescens HK44 TaxID=1042209 RepID=A0A010RVP0_PSEFL|nr:HEPN domain-containing protein [Pseudomonas fluorescens]EXF96296.1 hypothetical protein HK44_020795 [Pseudomonas fluorescens HK44]